MRNFKNLTRKEKAEYISILILYPFFLIFSRLGKSFKFFADRKRQLVASALCFAIVLGSVPLLSLKSSAAAGDKPTSLKVYVYNLGGDDFFQMVQGSTKTYLIGDRTFSTTKEDNWTLEYDPSSGTLTMRNFYAYGQTHTVIESDKSLKIKLEGTSSVDGNGNYGCYGIQVKEGNLTINGDGILRVSSDNSYALLAGGNISIEESAVVYAQALRECIKSESKTIKVGYGAMLSAVTRYNSTNTNVLNVPPMTNTGHTIKTETKETGYDEPLWKTDYDPDKFDTYRGIRIVPNTVKLVKNYEELKAAVNDTSVKKIIVTETIEFPEQLSLNRSVPIYAEGTINNAIETFKRAQGYKGGLISVDLKYDYNSTNIYGINMDGESIEGNAPAVTVNKGSLSLYNSHIINFKNMSGNGGAVYINKDAKLYLCKRFNIVNNYAALSGGGIYNEGWLITESYKDSNYFRISFNEAGEKGGGVYQCKDGVFQFFGQLEVSQNKANGKYNNVYLQDGAIIAQRTPSLTWSNIGITMEENDRNWAYVVTGTSENDVKFYSCDEKGYIFKRDSWGKLEMRVAHQHYLCGESCSDGNHEKIKFHPWTETNRIPDEEGYYYLENDITTSYYQSLTKNVAICLNGHKISNNSGSNNPMQVGYSNNTENVANITDCQYNKGTITGTVSKCFDVYSTLNFYGGTIKGFTWSAVNLKGNGKFNMYGGAITENRTGSRGAAVSLYENSQFNMYGGSIYNNTSESGYVSGAIYQYSPNSKIGLYGGNIYKNTSTYVGGIFATNIELSGNVRVYNNTKNGTEQNIYLYKDGYIYVAGPLTGNKSITIMADEPKNRVVVKPVEGYTLTEEDFAKFKYENSDYITAWQDGNIVLRRNLKTFNDSDFDVKINFDKDTYSGKYLYSGSKFTVTVTPKSDITCGKITVKYYNEAGEELSSAPINAGNYYYSFHVAEDDNYAEFESQRIAFEISPYDIRRHEFNISVNDADRIYNINGCEPIPNISFKTDKFDLVKDRDYTISYKNNKIIGTAKILITFIGNFENSFEHSFSIHYGYADATMYSIDEANANDWYKSDINVKAKDGYKIGKTASDFRDKVVLSKTGKNKNDYVYLINSNGYIYRKYIQYNLDKENPEVTIAVKDNAFKSFLNKISFGLFFKESVDVKITAEDNLSSSFTFEYQLVNSEDEFDENGTWITGDNFSLSPTKKVIIYAKGTDLAGNSTIVSSEGIVMYSDSSVAEGSYVFDKNIEKQTDVAVKLNLNGNGIKEIALSDGTKLNNSTDYTVDGENVIFKKELLKNYSDSEKIAFNIVMLAGGVSGAPEMTVNAEIEYIDTTHQHFAVHHNRVEATCLKDGNIEYYTCTGCDYKFTDEKCQNKITDIVIPKLDHKNAVKTEVKPETCTEIGNLAYWYCPDCEKYFADNNNSLDKSSSKKTNSEFIKKALGHKFTAKSIDDKYLIKAATCTEEAVYCFKCERCDACDKSLTHKYGNPLGHKFENYVYNNNATYFEDGTKTAKCKNGGCNATDTKTEWGTKLLDNKAPTAEISIKNNKFTSLLNNITFGLFFKNTDTISVKAEDNESGLKSVRYFVSDKEITDFENVEWSEYKDPFAINPDGKYIVYVKALDKVGNAKIISSDGLVIDSFAPQTNITNGKTYCSAFEAIVSDDNIDFIELNGERVTLINGKITVSPKSGKQTLKAQDKSGNVTELQFTVNDGHVYDEGKITTEPTAAKEGVKTFTCVHCSDSYTEPVAKTKPVIIDGMNGKFIRSKSEILSFRSDAALADFLNVAVDGKVIDSKYYTTAEGSTIVRLSEEYLKTLADGSHTLDIISLSGTASTTFTVEAKSSTGGTLSPKTGFVKDNALWLIILIAVWTAVGAVVFVQRKEIFK